MSIHFDFQSFNITSIPFCGYTWILFAFETGSCYIPVADVYWPWTKWPSSSLSVLSDMITCRCSPLPVPYRLMVRLFPVFFLLCYEQCCLTLKQFCRINSYKCIYSKRRCTNFIESTCLPCQSFRTYIQANGVCVSSSPQQVSVYFTFLICQLKKLLLLQNSFAVLRISLRSEFVISFLVLLTVQMKYLVQWKCTHLCLLTAPEFRVCLYVIKIILTWRHL